MTNIAYSQSNQTERVLPPSVNGVKGAFKYFWQGVETVNGKKELNGIPALFMQNGEPQVRYILTANVAGAEFEYPGSFSLADLPMFAAAFGIKPAEVEALNVESNPSSGLLKLQEYILAKNNLVTFSAVDKSGKGAWIRRVNEMSAPDGSYLVKILEFFPRKDGKASWEIATTKYKDEVKEVPRTYFRAVIVSGEYAGFKVLGSLDYPFHVTSNGSASLKNKSDGTPTAASKRFVDFCLTTKAAKKSDTGGLSIDATFADQNNLMPEIEEAVLKAGTVCLAEVKGLWITNDGLTALPAGFEPQLTVTKKKRTPADVLYDLVGKNVSPAKVHNADGSYTPEAQQWLKDNVKPICTSLRIPSNISAMNSAQIVSILAELGDEQGAHEVNEMSEEVSDF